MVVEVEQRIVEWHATHLGHITGEALADPRVGVLVADVAEHLASCTGAYDVICLDVDNGPDWTVTDDNAGLYARAGMGVTVRALRPGGVLAVWSASASPAFEVRLREELPEVRVVEVPAGVARVEPTSCTWADDRDARRTDLTPPAFMIVRR